ncbi:vesicle transport protein SFT2B-like [Oppia nitens]|uniref:vesicle transport protein SFT2B-like n=1 Tax=Oppia nitens TaxID=1686743 RepID=UPI0023DAD419|nr:vesicle transport protein SFT2B-like [Oppia nitens]
MDSLRRTFGNNEESENNESFFPSLSWSTRLQGFVICFILGFVMSIIGGACIALPKGLVLFALFYTLGNIISMASTMFLMGPIRQFRNMFAMTRIFATLAVILFMILTLMAGLWWHNTGLAIIFCILQFIAFIWYSLSYIPFARDVVKKTFSSCV